MARSQVADGDDLQIWRVAANILKKQSRTSDSGWFSRLWDCAWGKELLTVKNKLVTTSHKDLKT
jgi:hypothetical protein